MSSTVQAPTVEPPAAPEPAAAKPAKDPSKEKETLAGVAIPGGALTGIIMACGLLHFGGPLLLLSATAAAAAGGTTAAIVKSRRKDAKSRRPGLRDGGRGPAAGPARTGGAGNVPGARKPPAPGQPNTGPGARQNTAAVRSIGAPPARGTANPGHRPVPSPGAKKTPGVPLRPSSATKPGGVSAIKHARPGQTPAPGKEPSKKNSAGAPAGTPTSRGSHAAPRPGPAARLANIARRLTGTPAASAAPGPATPKTPGKPNLTLHKGGNPTGPSLNPGKARRAWTTTRHRTRAAYRWASPRMARALIRTRMTLVKLRSRARFVRLRHLGPNWWPGIAKAWAAALHALIKAGSAITILPAARRWIASYMPRPVPVAGLTFGTVPSNVRRIYTSTPTTGAPPMADPVIIEAAEQIRTAFATIAADPASSMRGYEAALIALPDLLAAIGEGLTGFADVTRDQFAVQDAVPDMLGEGATHAQGLGSYLQDVHAHYRTIHDQQIANYEEPTVGSEKWDVVANQE